MIDVLWYREIGQSSVFWTTLRTKVLLGRRLRAAVLRALLYVNLVIARTAPADDRDPVRRTRRSLERIRDVTDPLLRWLLPLGAAVLGFFVGARRDGRVAATSCCGATGGRDPFGTTEPLFGRDPAFYVFTLPWLRFLQGWLFSSLVGVTLLSAIAHVLWGGIRPQAPVFADKVTPAARAHLSVLLGLIMLVKAWGYWLGRFDLLTSPRGRRRGRLLHRRERAAPGAQLPGDRRRHLRDPVLR